MNKDVKIGLFSSLLLIGICILLLLASYVLKSDFYIKQKNINIIKGEIEQK
jgi:hypothetical protein